ncbi:hypothetical protein DFH08DRAFT_822317 [Mycena albidolilacea]|uniref:Uncharacterized protein n=1 Tax=Mycena albidolilacea TaxID=1033008 RepID=A0AAD6Z8Y5_9AGAR|nr:hypothetical protein DFH08DRAFT_822317 [Mycena albidolilacea]
MGIPRAGNTTGWLCGPRWRCARCETPMTIQAAQRAPKARTPWLANVEDGSGDVRELETVRFGIYTITSIAGSLPRTTAGAGPRRMRIVGSATARGMWEVWMLQEQETTQFMRHSLAHGAPAESASQDARRDIGTLEPSGARRICVKKSDLGEKIIFHLQTWQINSWEHTHLPVYKINTEPKPGFEEDPDPKKIDFERLPAGFLFVVYLRELELIWCKKKTGPSYWSLRTKNRTIAKNGQFVSVADKSQPLD